MGLDPLSPIHMRPPEPDPSPLRVDVINGRPHTVPLFHAEAPHATASEGLTQGPYLAARAGFKSTTLRAKGVESTNAPPHPMILCMYMCVCVSQWQIAN